MQRKSAVYSTWEHALQLRLVVLSSPLSLKCQIGAYTCGLCAVYSFLFVIIIIVTLSSLSFCVQCVSDWRVRFPFCFSFFISLHKIEHSNTFIWSEIIIIQPTAFHSWQPIQKRDSDAYTKCFVLTHTSTYELSPLYLLRQKQLQYIYAAIISQKNLINFLLNMSWALHFIRFFMRHNPNC